MEEQAERTITGRTRLAELQRNLRRLNRDWKGENHDALIALFVRLLPGTLEAERAAVFVLEKGSQRIVSRTGTGLASGEIVAPTEGSVVGRVIASGLPAIEHNLDVRDGFHVAVDQRTGFTTRSVLCVPVLATEDQAVIGAIEVLNKGSGGRFVAADRELLEGVADLLARAIESVVINHEIGHVSKQIERELGRRVRAGEDEFIGASPPMRELVERARVVSELPVNALLLGANGTGKERIARMIHDQGEHWEGPFVAVNCASIPESLVESELFGYEKGAFTGAAGARGGTFEEAEGGTLFLDEIGELPPAIQPKLLRVLQEGEGRRLGGGRLRRYNFRLLSATNRDLRAEVEEGRFREDLYYRLFSVELKLPRLADRAEDLMTMAHVFLRNTCRRFGKHIDGFAPAVVARFETYEWPGNVRQLRNEIERAVAFTPSGGRVELTACSPELSQGPSSGCGCVSGSERATLPERVQALERELIREALAVTEGNRQKAAKHLGISRQGLYKKLDRYELA
jgi:transcriptional regulator with GAF, ATPase, and Fis domain